MPQLRLLIQPGTAAAEDIADLLYEISKLNRMLGGNGIEWKVTECRLPK